MNSDDDEDEPTPRMVKRRFQTSDDRDLAARRSRSHPHGVPITGATLAYDPDETDPFAVIAADPTDEDLAAVRRSRRESDSPVTAIQLAQVVRHLQRKLRRLKEQEASNNEERANQLLELLNRAPDAVTAELHNQVVRMDAALGKLEREFAPIRSFSKWALGVAGAAAVAVAVFLYQRGFGEGGSAVRIELLERTVNELHRDVRALERRDEPDPLKGHAP